MLLHIIYCENVVENLILHFSIWIITSIYKLPFGDNGMEQVETLFIYGQNLVTKLVVALTYNLTQ